MTLSTETSVAQAADAADKPLSYRPDIDGLRAVAVGLVVIYHAFPKIRTGGFVGVDVFFVISGYLITGIVLSGLNCGRFELAVFYQRRVRRIIPALLVVMAACCAFAWLTLLPAELRWLGKSLSWCAAFLANMFFATRTGGYFEPANESNPLLHLWSLGVEEQFYLAWPILLMLAVRYGVTLRVLGAVVAASLAISIWGAWYDAARHFYLPAARAWELAIGGLLAGLQPGMARGAASRLSTALQSWQPRARQAGSAVGLTSLTDLTSLAGLALIIAGGVLWKSDVAVPGIWSVLPTTGATLLIWAGPHALVNRSLLASRPMIWLGRISYPLYLWHWPIFSFTYIFLGRFAPPAVAACEIVLAVAAADATYRLLELPVRRGEFGRKAVPVLLAGLAGFALLGAAADARWVPGRLSGPLFVRWDDAVTDWHYPGETDVDSRTGLLTLSVPSHRNLKAVFIGDSHIQQYWPRVDYVVRREPDVARTAVFASHSACPPLPGIENRRPGHDCSAIFDHAIERACQPDVDTVVFGAFWESYFMGAYGIENARQPVYSTTDRARTTLHLDSPGTQVAFRQFQRVLERLSANGRRVFIVLSNPAAPQFIPVFPYRIRLSLHPPQNLRADGGSSIDVAPFESFAAPLTDRLRRIAGQTGAVTVDPRSALCDGTKCPTAASDGLPLYFDAGHIRGRTARERASFIDQMLLGPETASHGSCAH